MNHEIKKKSVFQIVEFHKKREGLYSTRISDGYFRLKVLFMKSAAKQLDDGEIALFNILESRIKSHGKGVVMVKDHCKIFKYGRTIGLTKEWRLFKLNTNPLGNN